MVSKVLKIFIKCEVGNDVCVDNPVEFNNGEWGWTVMDENYLEIFIPTRNILGVELHHEKLNRVD